MESLNRNEVVNTVPYNFANSGTWDQCSTVGLHWLKAIKVFTPNGSEMTSVYNAYCFSLTTSIANLFTHFLMISLGRWWMDLQWVFSLWGDCLNWVLQYLYKCVWAILLLQYCPTFAKCELAFKSLNSEIHNNNQVWSHDLHTLWRRKNMVSAKCCER